MINACQDLQETLNKEIPLTKALQIKVISWEKGQLQLELPLSPNVNHMDSAFGGSLYCAAVLAGWGWMYLRLKEIGITDGHIVIQDATISYPHPVLGDGIVQCNPPSDEDWTKFEKIVKRHHRGRLALTSCVIYDGKEAVTFNGHFVVYSK